MPSKIQNLIGLYDCIGWIPTIRGCLSLELIDDASSILGDVDKYSVRFKVINGLHSQHYLIASALLTVNDTKVGRDIDRTFRYVFTGSINDKDIVKRFMEGNSLTSDELLNEYMVKEGLLLGHLFIVFENDLTDLEASFLKGLQRLTKDNEDYLKAFHVQAKSMEVLNACRATMQTEWK